VLLSTAGKSLGGPCKRCKLVVMLTADGLSFRSIQDMEAAMICRVLREERTRIVAPSAGGTMWCRRLDADRGGSLC